MRSWMALWMVVFAFVGLIGWQLGVGQGVSSSAPSASQGSGSGIEYYLYYRLIFG